MGLDINEFKKQFSEMVTNEVSKDYIVSHAIGVIKHIEYQSKVKENELLHSVRLSFVDRIRKVVYGKGSAQERMVDVKLLFDNEA